MINYQGNKEGRIVPYENLWLGFAKPDFFAKTLWHLNPVLVYLAKSHTDIHHPLKLLEIILAI
jgi:hypothetical protein